jgi:hypothetical protein
MSEETLRMQNLTSLTLALKSLRPTRTADEASNDGDATAEHDAEAAPVNMVQFAKDSLLRRMDSPADQATIEVVASVIDCILGDPCLPTPVKVVFARLQVPLLKSTLVDPSAFMDAEHPARSFVDGLFRATVGLRDSDPRAEPMLQLARDLAERTNSRPGSEHVDFAIAKSRLDGHLNAERTERDQRIANALPDLLATESRIVAREKVQEILSVQLTGWRLPAAAHRLLTHEWLDHLTDKYLESGPESATWNQERALIDDLMWSLSAEATNDRARLRRLLPGLVKSVSNGQAIHAVVEPWRKLVLDYMFTSHLGALRPMSDRASAKEPLKIPMAPPASTASGAIDVRVHALARGDWCEFRPAGEGGERGEPVLAQLAWRSPHRTQLLFTHRNGDTAFVHTPVSLSDEFRSGRVVVAVEDVPVFERAMRQILER